MFFIWLYTWLALLKPQSFILKLFRVFFLCVSACVWTCTLMFFAERNHSGWMWNKNVFSKILESPSDTKKLKSVIWHEHKLTYFRCKHSKSNVISEELLTKFFFAKFLNTLYFRKRSTTYFMEYERYFLWKVGIWTFCGMNECK